VPRTPLRELTALARLPRGGDWTRCPSPRTPFPPVGPRDLGDRPRALLETLAPVNACHFNQCCTSTKLVKDRDFKRAFPHKQRRIYKRATTFDTTPEPKAGPLLPLPQCSHRKRCTSYGNSVRLPVRPSVYPSVRPSHAGIVSKRLHVARCSLHCQIAKCV